MKISLENTQAFQLISKNQAGKTLTTDASQEIGGHGEGFRPMEVMLCAIGSCSSIDVIQILKKYRQPYRKYRVDIEATRVEETPQIFSRVNLSYYVESNITLAQFERAVSLSLKKYCSVSKMIIPEVNLSYHCEVKEYSI